MSFDVNASFGNETLQQLFEVTEKDLASGITPEKLTSAAEEDGRASFGKWLASSSWSSVSSGLATQLTTFLQDDLVGVFAGCWAKYEELQKCAEESRKDPNSTSTVALAEHEFSWNMSPSIEIRFDGMPVTKIPFSLGFVFGVSGLELSLKAGCVQAVGAGKCNCRGEIGCGGQTIWTKALAAVDLPGKLQLKEPIVLAKGKVAETMS